MIYIYGSGGRGKLIKELLIRLGNAKKEIMFVDDKKKKFKRTNYLIKRFNRKKDQLFIGIADPKLQIKKYFYFKKKLKNIDNHALIDPRAVLKSNNKIGKNVIILENTSIGPNVVIMKNVFIGSRSIINHDCKIGSFSTIGHGTNLAGSVKINNNCVLGISTTIKQNINVGSNVIIGSASNVIKNCLPNSKYVGNPCRKIS